MPDYPMTELIAASEYVLETHGERARLQIEVGKPARIPDSRPRFQETATLGHWYCPFTIQEDGRTLASSGGGIDSLQALKSSLSAIDAILEAKGREGKLTPLDEVT